MAQRFGASFQESAQQGREAAWRATGGRASTGNAGGASASNQAAGTEGGEGNAPAWAQRLRNEQRMKGHADMATRAIQHGDRPSGAANPDLQTKED
jgi:type IV secretion system protein TrbL